MIGYEGHCHLVEDECSKCTMLGANMNFCVRQTEQEFNLTIQFPEGDFNRQELVFWHQDEWTMKCNVSCDVSDIPIQMTYENQNGK